TRKAAAKRFKLTGTGKLVRRCSFQNHKMMCKSGSAQRRLDLGATVKHDQGEVIRAMLQIGAAK
ncbi:MAG TPA: 50S ribosomal protein L35, partial [Armatimonadota bacterium]